MHLTPGVVHNFQKAVGVLDSYAQKDPRFLFEKTRGSPGNSGLSSQHESMVVHYTRTVRKNSHAEHNVTGKTYNKKSYICNQASVFGTTKRPH